MGETPSGFDPNLIGRNQDMSRETRETVGREWYRVIFLRDDGEPITLGQAIETQMLTDIYRQLRDWPEERWIALIRLIYSDPQYDQKRLIFHSIGSFDYQTVLERMSNVDSRIGRQFLESCQQAILYTIERYQSHEATD